MRNDVFAPVDGDTGERDRLCRFHRHRDLAQIIRRNHNKLSPAWSFEAVTTPGQGSTHLTIDHFLARGRKTEHWPRSPHVHFDEWQDRYYSDTNGQNAPRSCGAITGTGVPDRSNPDIPGRGLPPPLATLAMDHAVSPTARQCLHDNPSSRRCTRKVIRWVSSSPFTRGTM